MALNLIPEVVRVNIEMLGDKIGYAFNNSMFNVSTSGVGVYYTGTRTVRSFAKGLASPLPWCKTLYFTASALHGVSCASSGLCLLAGYSCLAPVPILAASCGQIAAVGGSVCNSMAECMDPTASVANSAIDKCIDLAAKNVRL